MNPPTLSSCSISVEVAFLKKMGDRVRTWMYLDDMVLANSGQKLPSSIIAHVLHYVPENT